MVDSVSESLERDLECLDLLGCIHGLNERDQTVFEMLQEADDPLTVDEVTERIGCDRSTAYRSISRLLEAGVVVQKQVNYDNGGYYHVYQASTPEEVTSDMQRMLNDWYADISQLIHRFEDTYTSPDQCPPSLRER